MESCSEKRFGSVSPEGISLSVDVECAESPPCCANPSSWWGLDFLCIRESVDFIAFISLACREDKKIIHLINLQPRKLSSMWLPFFDWVYISGLVMESFGGKEGVRTEG